MRNNLIMTHWKHCSVWSAYHVVAPSGCRVLIGNMDVNLRNEFGLKSVHVCPWVCLSVWSFSVRDCDLIIGVVWDCWTSHLKGALTLCQDSALGLLWGVCLENCAVSGPSSALSSHPPSSLSTHPRWPIFSPLCWCIDLVSPRAPWESD